MKKFFTLIAAAMMVVGANAQDYVLQGGDNATYATATGDFVIPIGKNPGSTITDPASFTCTTAPGITCYMLAASKTFSNGAYVTYGGTEMRTFKLSNGAPTEIDLPEGVTISKVEFIGYSNDASNDTWIAQMGMMVDGVYQDVYTNDGSKDLITVRKGNIIKDESNRDVCNVEPGVITIENLSLSGKVFLKNGGKQPCFVINLYKGNSTGIDGIVSENNKNENAPVYNLAGQRVSKEAKGILIQNGKKFINNNK